MSNQYEMETAELSENLKERVFVLDENGHSVPLEIEDDTEDKRHA